MKKSILYSITALCLFFLYSLQLSAASFVLLDRPGNALHRSEAAGNHGKTDFSGQDAGKTDCFVKSPTGALYGARYYDPRTSVWQSTDPAFWKGEYLPTGDKRRDQNLPGLDGIYNSLNTGLYTYSHLNPIKIVDPDGNRPLRARERSLLQGVYDHKLDYDKIDIQPAEGIAPYARYNTIYIPDYIENMYSESSGLSESDVAVAESMFIHEAMHVHQHQKDSIGTRIKAFGIQILKKLGIDPYPIDPKTDHNFDELNIEQKADVPAERHRRSKGAGPSDRQKGVPDTLIEKLFQQFKGEGYD